MVKLPKRIILNKLIGSCYLKYASTRGRFYYYITVPGDNRFLGLNEHLHVASRHSGKGVFLNLASKLALESRLRAHHPCKNVRFKQLIRNP
jgi:hypothetical protein